MKSALACLGCILLLGIAASAQYVAIDITPAGLSGQWNATSGSVFGGVAYSSAMPNGHAYLSNGTAFRDLNPPNWYSSQVLGEAGGQRVGFGLAVPSVDLTAGTHALLWVGATASRIDLNMSNWGYTFATCTTGSQQGGYGLPPKGKGKASTNTHALIWSGSAASAIDLNPTGIVESRIYGCSGTVQVGYVTPAPGGASHAAMWFGSAASYLDLNPTGYITSMVSATTGSQQVGSGFASGSNRHALLWTGSAESVVDLHPAAYSSSSIYATNGLQQAGEATDNGFPQHKHALAWSGTAATAVDLNQFLPAGFTDASARAIDVKGNIVGFATSSTQSSHMIIWMKQ